MSKVTRLKGDLDDVDTLLEIISVIRDLATNRFFAFAQKKANFQRFFELFMNFFHMVQHLETDCPLLKNESKGVDILVLASDQAFMSQLNNRVASLAVQQYKQNPGAVVTCVGRRCADRMRMLGLKNFGRIFSVAEIPDRYKLAMVLREYLVGRVMNGESGKCILVHLWAKTFTIIKPRILILLPALELVRTKGGDITEGEDAQELFGSERKIELMLESKPDKIIKALVDIWIHSRLYEIISDLILVEAAVQAQQLESALESLGTEKKQLMVSFRKAGREELNKAMREVFTQTSASKGKR